MTSDKAFPPSLGVRRAATCRRPSEPGLPVSMSARTALRRRLCALPTQVLSQARDFARVASTRKLSVLLGIPSASSSAASTTTRSPRGGIPRCTNRRCAALTPGKDRSSPRRSRARPPRRRRSPAATSRTSGSIRGRPGARPRGAGSCRAGDPGAPAAAGRPRGAAVTLGRVPAPVDNVGPEEEVADEVGHEHEEEPPDPPARSAAARTREARSPSGRAPGPESAA